MSILKTLKLATAQAVRASNDPVERARGKVLGALSEQRAMAEAKIAGQHYALTRTVWRKNEDGVRVAVETPKRLRAGWFVDASGQTFFGLRYAGKTIEFAKDKNPIAVGELWRRRRNPDLCFAKPANPRHRVPCLCRKWQ